VDPDIITEDGVVVGAGAVLHNITLMEVGAGDGVVEHNRRNQKPYSATN